MNRLFQLKWTPAAVLYLVGVLVSVDAGMGMPFCCIGLGFLVGWYLARRELRHANDFSRMLRRATRTAVVTSLFTFLMMAVIWGPRVGMAFGPRANLPSVGLPAILRGAHEGLIIWALVMVIISPLLQLITTVFASQLTFLRCLSPYVTAAQKAKMSELTAYRLKVLGARTTA
jgi:hypothetical protein